MQSKNKDAPWIPSAAGANKDVKSSVESYRKYHQEKDKEGHSRQAGYAEVCTLTTIGFPPSTSDLLLLR